MVVSRGRGNLTESIIRQTVSGRNNGNAFNTFFGVRFFFVCCFWSHWKISHSRWQLKRHRQPWETLSRTIFADHLQLLSSNHNFPFRFYFSIPFSFSIVESPAKCHHYIFQTVYFDSDGPQYNNREYNWQTTPTAIDKNNNNNTTCLLNERTTERTKLNHSHKTNNFNEVNNNYLINQIFKYCLNIFYKKINIVCGFFSVRLLLNGYWFNGNWIHKGRMSVRIVVQLAFTHTKASFWTIEAPAKRHELLDEPTVIYAESLSF